MRNTILFLLLILSLNILLDYLTHREDYFQAQP